jgi:hypothetical protein
MNHDVADPRSYAPRGVNRAVAEGGEMAQLTVRAGRAYLVLSKCGVDVDLDITHYTPGRRGLPPPAFPEEVAIFIGTGVGSGLIGAIAADVYNKAKHWAKNQYEGKRKAAQGANKDPGYVKGERFTIYGPDGNILKSWTVDKNGEHESNGN